MTNRNNSMTLSQVDRSLTDLRNHPYTKSLINYNYVNGSSQPIELPVSNRRSALGRIIYHLSFFLGLLYTANYIYSKQSNFRNEDSRAIVFQYICYILYYLLLILKKFLSIPFINQYSNLIFSSIPTLSVSALLAFTQSPQKWTLAYLPALYTTYQTTQFLTTTLLSNSNPVLVTINTTLSTLKPIINNRNTITNAMVRINSSSNMYISRKINKLIYNCALLLISFILAGAKSHFNKAKNIVLPKIKKTSLLLNSNSK